MTVMLQDTVESMVRSAQDKCPNVLSEEKVVNDVRAACMAKSQVCYFIEMERIFGVVLFLILASIMFDWSKNVAPDNITVRN